VTARRALHPDLTLCTRFHRAIELIGRRWTGAIVYVLLRSRCRYATLRDAIPDITDRMLSERLQELEHEGIVERTVVPETPVRVEYALTKKGRALASAIDATAAWAERWVELEPSSARTAAPERARRRAKPPSILSTSAPSGRFPRPRDRCRP
jgi:DNA-binding HxlR family transcriptional regulator